MADKLDTNANANAHTRGLWKRHQANEYTKVSAHNEAVCFDCFSIKPCNATIADICGDCAGKRGREALLTVISQKLYGLCYFCNTYKFNLEQINVRLCMKCHRRVADVTKAYNKAGGVFGYDPFWQKMRRKHGKDWKHIFADTGKYNR